MRENRVKRTPGAGGVSIGTTVFEFATTGIARIAAEAGADFVLFDMEHTGWTVETVRGLMATARAAETVPLVRVPAVQYHRLAGPLDVGAMGLAVPMVESAEQARLIVRSAKFHPLGARGAGPGLAQDDYAGQRDISARMRSVNEEVLLIAQIETAAGVEAVDAIAATEGIDVLWIGGFDLSTSLGIPAQFDHPDYLRAVAKILNACARYNEAPGYMAANVAEARALIGQGFRWIAYWGDVWIYQEALRQGIAAIRPRGTS